MDSKDFQIKYPDLLYDDDRADVAGQKCHHFKLKMMNSNQPNLILGKNPAIKMFQCPMKNKHKSDKDTLYVCPGRQSRLLFLFIDSSGMNDFIGMYSTKTVNE